MEMSENYIIDSIRSLMPDANVEPQAVVYERLKLKVQKDLAKTLGRLAKANKIGYHKTINSIIIYIKKDEENKIR